jgi:hypothetical protein
MEITRTVKTDPLTQTVKNRLQDLTDRLGGTIQYSDWRNSRGESGKRIIIQYNHAETN